jgi:hypothetical protein
MSELPAASDAPQPKNDYTRIVPEAVEAPEAQAEAAEPARSELEKPQTKRFRRRFDAVRLSPDQATRQGEAATAAWLAFKDRDAMVAFLNTHDDDLGGRPIDLAVESVEGLATVKQALAARSA